jgi:hypothetical protein
MLRTSVRCTASLPNLRAVFVEAVAVGAEAEVVAATATPVATQAARFRVSCIAGFCFVELSFIVPTEVLPMPPIPCEGERGKAAGSRILSRKQVAQSRVAISTGAGCRLQAAIKQWHAPRAQDGVFVILQTCPLPTACRHIEMLPLATPPRPTTPKYSFQMVEANEISWVPVLLFLSTNVVSTIQLLQHCRPCPNVCIRVDPAVAHGKCDAMLLPGSTCGSRRPTSSSISCP